MTEKKNSNPHQYTIFVYLILLCIYKQVIEIEKSVYSNYILINKKLVHLIHSRIIFAHLKQKKISINSLVTLLCESGFNYKYQNVYSALNNRGRFINTFNWFVPLYEVLKIDILNKTELDLLQLFIDSNEYINNNLGANKYQPFVLKYPKQ